MLSKFLVAGLATATTVLGEGFEVVIKYVQPADGTCTCAHADETLSLGGGSTASSTYAALPSTPVVSTVPDYSTDDAAGPITTIVPSVHWTCDTKKIENVVPKEPSAASPLYYGSSDPTVEGYFGWLTYHFSTCAVNLDESAYISYSYDSKTGLRITFSSQTAFDLAVKSWNADDGLVLVGFISGCGEDHDRCYFKVLSLDIDSGKLCITATGTSEDPHDLIDKASTEFGWWVPGRPQGSGGSSSGTQTISASVNSPSSTSSSFVPSSTGGFTGGSSINSTSASNTTSSDDAAASSSFTDSSTACTAPVDDVYGLPTACLTEYFDEDLSDLMGYYSLDNNTVYEKFIDSVAPDEYDGSDSAAARRLARRGFFSAFKNAVSKIVSVGQAIVQKVQQATSISGSINKSLSFKLPDPSSSDSSAKTLKDSSLKQADSPWGSAILLKSFGDSEKFGEAKGKAGYLNVYCVDCGAQGSVKVAGRAAWTPIGMTFTEGQLEMHADLKVGLKLGVDAKIKYSKTFENSILDFGLPGLSYGIITIGPRVSVGSAVTLNAAAEGKLLAGAEMGIADSMVLLDWVTTSNSKTQGWQPYFKPVFQADGEIMVSAELGLPVGLKCGIKIASWDKSVGITDTPSIKATAQIAASIGLSDNGFTGGLNSTDGCAGIATSISWRNKIDVDILGLWDKTLFDTNDKVLKQDCIKLGSSSSTTTAATSPTANPTAGGDTEANPTATAGGDAEATASPTAGGDAEETSSPTTGGDAEETASPTAGGDAEETSSPTTGGDAEETSSPTTGGGAEETSSPTEDGDSEETSLPEVVRMFIRDSVNSSSDNTTVVDITSKVKGNDTLTYTVTDVPSSSYNQTNGYEYSLLVDPEVLTMLVACSNGNMYLASVNATSLDYCTELFATYSDLLVEDGGGRYMHYYNNTMAKVGVSRLRVAENDDMPTEAVPIVMVPYSVTDDSSTATKRGEADPDSAGYDDYNYYAVDPYDNLFYPAVCTYADGSLPRVFIVNDPELGIAKLKESALVYSVTGGVVDDCFVLALVEAKYDDDSDYTSTDNTSDVSLSYDDE